MVSQEMPLRLGYVSMLPGKLTRTTVLGIPVASRLYGILADGVDPADGIQDLSRLAVNADSLSIIIEANHPRIRKLVANGNRAERPLPPVVQCEFKLVEIVALRRDSCIHQV